MKRRFLLVVLVALTFVGASWPLNPLVTRLSEPTGPVPAGCEDGLAPSASPRVNVAEIPEREVILPASMPAPPPSRSLRQELDAAHRALVGNDRPAFDEHLRAARAIVETYPAGGERSRAEEVLWALNDAAVLWDAQFQSPFFDENSDAYARASRYAGYADAMRRSVLTDDSNRRFYPAAESRDFVTRVAAERLQRLGVRGTATAPPRVARAETPSARPATASPQPRTSTRRRSTASATPKSTSKSTSRATPKSRKPAALAKSAPSSLPDPSDAAQTSSAPAVPAPTAPPASAPAPAQSKDASASPVAGDVEPTRIVGDPADTDTAAPASAPVTTGSAPEPAPATTTTAAPAPAQQRSVILPAILILIGLGVLIVLFRASK